MAGKETAQTHDVKLCQLFISNLFLFNFLFQMCSSISAHCSTPQQLVIPDGGDGGSAQGSDAEEQQRSAQAVTPTH